MKDKAFRMISDEVNHECGDEPEESQSKDKEEFE